MKTIPIWTRLIRPAWEIVENIGCGHEENEDPISTGARVGDH
jgi:hypothetical protein